MSGECPAGSLQGFPIQLPNNAFTMVAETPGNSDPMKLWKTTGREFDFSVNWSPSTSPWTVAISRSSDNALRNNRYFYVTGFDAISSGTTITYAGVSYVCDNAFAICNNQHGKLLFPFVRENDYPYEAILSFKIANPNANPSAPHIILLCRPFQFRENYNVAGWRQIADAVTSSSQQQSTFNPKSLFIMQDDLVPMISYETCINVQAAPRTGTINTSLRVKVCVGIIPTDLPANTALTAKCQDIARYRFRLATQSPFDTTRIQIKQSTSGAYPTPLSENYFPIQINNGETSNGESLVNYIQVLVPSAVFGQDPTAIVQGTAPKKPTGPLRATKCYRVDTAKDIKNGQILVDPTTGQSVSNTLNQEAIDNAGGDIELARALQGQPPENPGILPGDIQQGLLITGIVVGSIVGAALMFYVLFLLFYRKDYKNAATYGAVFVLALIGLLITSFAFAADAEKKE
jgi:hypothetical protein